MLDENRVVSILCAHLEKDGYEIVQRLNTTQQGTDIIAKKPGGDTLLIEAKGSTSTRRGSERYGKPYTRSQVLNRVAKGFYTAAGAAMSASAGEDSCLAFPETKAFVDCLDPIASAIDELGITVFFVSEAGVRLHVP